MVDTETPKRDPKELCDLLSGDAARSIAASVFNLRSFEYAFMDPIFVQVHYLRNPLLVQHTHAAYATDRGQRIAQMSDLFLTHLI